MTNTQLAELFLLRLYDLAESEGHGRFVVLNSIAAEFGVTDVMKINHLAQALENRGFIKRLASVGGTVRAHITGDGALVVEAGGETGVIRDYREKPQKYAVTVDQSTNFYGPVSGSHINVTSSVSVPPLPGEVVELFNKMLEKIQSDSDLTESSRRDLAADVANLRLELERAKPRRPIAEALLSTLGDASSITSFAIQLQQYLPALLMRLGG